jgi:hypothetical protein
MQQIAPRQLAANLYLGNSVVLITHEIDSAYWHEWELFGLPGGIQFFLVLHVALLGIVLWGYRSVILWTRGARTYSYLLASAGVFAVLIHGSFLAAGTPQFRSSTSVALLIGTLILSIWQIAVVKRCRNSPSLAVRTDDERAG